MVSRARLSSLSMMIALLATGLAAQTPSPVSTDEADRLSRGQPARQRAHLLLVSNILGRPGLDRLRAAAVEAGVSLKDLMRADTDTRRRVESLARDGAEVDVLVGALTA